MKHMLMSLAVTGLSRRFGPGPRDRHQDIQLREGDGRRADQGQPLPRQVHSQVPHQEERTNAAALLKSCTPPFDVGTGSTQECADKTVDKYADMITLKCSGFMPTCGGYMKGWCSNNTSTSCNRDIVDCPGTCSAGLCVHDGSHALRGERRLCRPVFRSLFDHDSDVMRQ